MSNSGSGEEEDTEESERQVPRMYGMGNAGEGCCNKTTSR